MTIQSIRFSYLCTFITLFCTVHTYTHTFAHSRDRCALKFFSITIIFFIHYYFICNVRSEYVYGAAYFILLSFWYFSPYQLSFARSFHSIHAFVRSLFFPLILLRIFASVFVSSVSFTRHSGYSFICIIRKIPFCFFFVPFVSLVYCFSFRLIRCFWAVYFALHQIHFDNCYFRNGFDCTLVLTN